MRVKLRALTGMMLCAAAALPALCAAAAGQEPGPRAKEARRLFEAVEVEGNRLLADEEILAHVRARPGEPYDEQQVVRDLRSLLDLGVFDRTQTRVKTEAGMRGGVVVIFHVVELPLIAGLRFEGLPKRLAEADVLKSLRAEGVALAEGDVYDPATLSRAVAVVKRLLAARGFRSVSVEGYTEEVSATRVIVRISVTDGRYF